MVDNPAQQVPLLPECIEAVRWWHHEDRWVFGIPIQVPPPSLLLHTNTSMLGLGAHLMAAGIWSREESSFHINSLEMKVVLALAAFLPQLLGQSIVLMSDSASVVVYLQNQGGMVSCVLYHMTAEIVLWTEYHSVSLLVPYILGKENVLADQLSRPK